MKPLILSSSIILENETSEYQVEAMIAKVIILTIHFIIEIKLQIRFIK